MRAKRLDEDDDWYIPAPQELPATSDQPAVPPAFAGVMAQDVPPELPLGTAYSPSRNRWRLPDGREIDAGTFRPVPPDRNTIDSQYFMMKRGYGPQRKRRTIAEGA